MARYVALLRGVNVAGKNKLPMSDLRSLLTNLGASTVRTYLQSGNAVFDHPAKGPGRLAAKIEQALADAGVPAKVLLRTPDELAAVLAGSPYLDTESDLTKLHVSFLATAPAADRASDLQVPPGESGTFTLRGKEVHLHCPDGYGRTKLNNTFIEKRLATVATTRNWKTVTALHELAGSDPD
ncbi:MAG: DUF1697 domain-containing protein [Jatrophihabitans sp.]